MPKVTNCSAFLFTLLILVSMVLPTVCQSFFESFGKKQSSSETCENFYNVGCTISGETLENPCGDWLPYKDEKCFKVIDDTLRTYDDAEKTCEKLENSPTLAIVHSQEEQDLLVNYIFKTLKKVDNFWIGAKYSDNSFIWNDHSSFTYSNWETRGPHKKENYCVQMLADEMTLGKWIDGPCQKKNAVVCQKTQTWSMVRFQKMFLESRKQFTDALTEEKKKNAILEKNFNELRQNLIPIGFIYTQLPNEKIPSTIWPWMEWSDVTATYAGVFFRVEGGGSGKFGKTQDENDNRLVGVETRQWDGKNGTNNDITEVNKIKDSQYSIKSAWIYTGDYAKDRYNFMNLRLITTTGEIRPRNMAVRIWKRMG